MGPDHRTVPCRFRTDPEGPRDLVSERLRPQQQLVCRAGQAQRLKTGHGPILTRQKRIVPSFEIPHTARTSSPWVALPLSPTPRTNSFNSSTHREADRVSPQSCRMIKMQARAPWHTDQYLSPLHQPRRRNSHSHIKLSRSMKK